MDDTRLTVVRHRIRVVGVSVGIGYFERDFLEEVVNEGPTELVWALVPIEDAQTSFQMLRLSAASRRSHLRTVPASITHQALADYDALVKWALRLSYWRRSCCGRGTNLGRSSPRSNRVPKPDLP